MTDMNQEILRFLKKMDERMTALESGRNPVREQKIPEPSQTDLICQKVKRDLTTRQLVRLSKYATGAEVRWARQELSNDKNLRIIKEGDETFVIRETTQKAPSLVVVAGVKQAKSYKKKQPSDKRTIIYAELDKGKTLTSGKIAKMLRITTSGANNYMDGIGSEDGYKLIRIGNRNQKLLSKRDIEPKLAKHEPPMRKKSAYNRFMAKKLSFYQKQGGLNGHDAFMAGIADWNRAKATSSPAPEAHQSHFPAFQSIKSELLPILMGVLERLFKNSTAIGFSGISYALDIAREEDYKELVREVIANQEALKSYFGLSVGRLVWNGVTLSFEG